MVVLFRILLAVVGWDDLYPHPSGGRTVLPYDEFRRFRDLIRHSAFRDVLSDDDDDDDG